MRNGIPETEAELSVLSINALKKRIRRHYGNGQRALEEYSRKVGFVNYNSLLHFHTKNYIYLDDLVAFSLTDSYWKNMNEDLIDYICASAGAVTNTEKLLAVAANRRPGWLESVKQGLIPAGEELNHYVDRLCTLVGVRIIKPELLSKETKLAMTGYIAYDKTSSKNKLFYPYQSAYEFLKNHYLIHYSKKWADNPRAKPKLTLVKSS